MENVSDCATQNYWSGWQLSETFFKVRLKTNNTDGKCLKWNDNKSKIISNTNTNTNTNNNNNNNNNNNDRLLLLLLRMFYDDDDYYL